MSGLDYVRFFEEVGIDDVPLVGGKNASLGEMYRELGAQGVRVPNGFAITAEAYRYMLEQAGAWARCTTRWTGWTPTTSPIWRGAASGRARSSTAPACPTTSAARSSTGYARLREEYGEQLSLAVRSSATAEDLPTASFAGQHETYLNIRGEREPARRPCAAASPACSPTARSATASTTASTTSRSSLSVGVMKMVRSDLAAAGVIFTLDTESGFRDAVFITGAYGLGENVVQGTVDPDEFYVFKPTFEAGPPRRAAAQARRQGDQDGLCARAGRKSTTRNVPTPKEDRERFCITRRRRARAGRRGDQDRGPLQRRPAATPMDIEWAKDGLDGQLYIVQARPETVASQRAGRPARRIRARRATGDVLRRAAARSASKIAAGRARVVTDVAQLAEFQPGEVLVADTTTPDWGTVMKSRRRDRHQPRRAHLPCGHRRARAGHPGGGGLRRRDRPRSRTGDEVTVSCAEGDTGRVYAGVVPFERRAHRRRRRSPRPQTQVMVNLGNPDIAFQTSFLPNDGVGLARMEFIITEHIKAHPMALLHPERVDDAGERASDRAADARLRDGRGVLRRAPAREGVGTIAAAFYPKPVIVRMSDFKTNEYASLLGGAAFEPRRGEPDDRLPRRVALRPPGLRGGLRARVRGDEAGARGDGPHQRQADDPVLPPRRGGRARAAAMAEHGLERGENGLEIYVMCEIPNNVILIDAFAEHFRRLLDRLERPDPAHARRRPRLARSSPSTSTSATRASRR